MELMAVSLLIAACGLDFLTIDTVILYGFSRTGGMRSNPSLQCEILDRQRCGIGGDLNN
jgi:hypothetical protein